MIRKLIAAVVVLGGILVACPAGAGEPGWVGQVVKPRSQRDEIRQTPIIYRPYRPLHFYGNTVRRAYYHGRVLPAPSEFGEAARAISEAR
ncbi:MAG: hypothetical protein GXX96_12215 [Planctomycetaceae bacterium]|nr:hypothetical protein [Planctomycetaceae bacterium]